MRNRRQKTRRVIQARYAELMRSLKNLRNLEYTDGAEKRILDEMFALRAAARSLIEERIGQSRRRPKKLTPLEKYSLHR